MSPKRFPSVLRDLGEKRIVDELIVPRFPPAPGQSFGIGDDCAVFPPQTMERLLVATTDPCPTPVICILEPVDLYHYGRLTMLINVSDLAAMGAEPLGLLVSTVMPEEMPIADYERFLDGLAEASKEWGCPVVGGNIKDGAEFSATGTAFGTVAPDSLLRRTGAKPGDAVCVIGEMGLFWSAVLARLAPGISIGDGQRQVLERALYRPVARSSEGMALAATKKVTSCMDSSDGVGGCLAELAHVNRVDIVVDSHMLVPHAAVRDVATAAGVDFRKLMLSWGNWELVCTVRADSFDEVRERIEALGTPCRQIGHVIPGNGTVWLDDAGQRAGLSNLASERFSGTSYFSHGLNAYVDHLRSQPLTVHG